ncbi:MAG TPA: HAD-IC family P-type ATPase [Mariprofundaceae bacterium]|nr:HAD-IC family P-type ATPase [Mariprofundaceae bacterium]
MKGMSERESDWHAMAAEAVFDRFGSGPEGLGAAEAVQRLSRYGPNVLPAMRPRSLWERLRDQFHNVLIYVLLGSAVVTSLIGHWLDTGVILGVVVINAVIGFVQEGKAEKALDAIRHMLSPKAMVLREGHRITLPAREVVPGDVIFLQSGDKVPADMRLFEARGLQIDEAILTGESMPVEKSKNAVAEDAVIGDRIDMVYSGTMVTRGQGFGLVVSVGHDTEIGRISGMLEAIAPQPTPLLRQVGRFGQWLTVWILAAAVVTFLYGMWVQGLSAVDMFLAAVGLSVAAIPEGLPAIMTITLAIGVQRMAGRNAIIRRLPAVETLGSVTAICSDKTGTLTRNEMTVQRVVTAEQAFEVGGVGYDPHGVFSLDGADIEPGAYAHLLELAKAALLCNDATLAEAEEGWRLHGEPTEGGLMAMAMKAGLEPELVRREYPRVDVIPFESEHRFMASLHHDHAGHGFIYIKGAPERILGMCGFQRQFGQDAPLDTAYWHAQIEWLAEAGQRVLAIAFVAAPDHHRELRFSDIEGGLTLLGLAGLSDPPREDAIEAVRRCRQAGIRVRMITGDHALTAQTIGVRLGIGERTMTGRELAEMDDEALVRALPEIDIFARTSPEDKQRLVMAMQALGDVVAMTGDGVNDAPALKRADIGVAMGVKGTEVAKEVAEMVLIDDRFASIAYAVEEGRTVYGNLQKAILFILPTSVGEAMTVIAAIIFGVLLPITPLQILWVNMITAVTLGLALAFEPPESDAMRRPPRPPGTPVLSRLLIWRIAFVSLIMLAGTFGIFLFQQMEGMPLEPARTVAVNTLVMFEAFYLVNTRYLSASVLSVEGVFGNRYVLLAIFLVVLLQLLFTYVPFMNYLFGTGPIGVGAWLQVVAVSASVFVLVEFEKWWTRRRVR